ncbi:MAG: transglutaminase domain-containing protein [Eubacteriales bacterium]|nr:transglutaminase domain-containing protein [Eubacteriales bacterium]
MKHKLILILLIVCMALVYTGCADSSEIENMEVDDIKVELKGAQYDAYFESLLSGPVLAPDEIPDETICTDYTGQGLLRIYYKSDTDAKLKLQVIMGDNTIVYNLEGGGDIEDFPLQYGDGEYTARIMENIQDDEYIIAESKTFTVTLADENDVFLNSVQNINWDYDMIPIEDVRYIVCGSLSDGQQDDLYLSCAEDLYQYIVDNIEYDQDKIYDLVYDYLPDIQRTYLENTGICYDYASLLAAMLRSINVPAKLVKGYANYSPGVYHAWNEVYINGEWIVIDTTRDVSLQGAGADYDMEKDSAAYTKVYEY